MSPEMTLFHTICNAHLVYQEIKLERKKNKGSILLPQPAKGAVWMDGQGARGWLRISGATQGRRSCTVFHINAELPGVELESEEADFAFATEEPEPNFWELAAAALDKGGINPNDRLYEAQIWKANVTAAPNAPAMPALIEANDDEFV